MGVALTALSRKVAEWIWHILMTGEPFRHEEPKTPKVRPTGEAKQRRTRWRAKQKVVPRVTTMERIQKGLRTLTATTSSGSTTNDRRSGDPASGVPLDG